MMKGCIELPHPSRRNARHHWRAVRSIATAMRRRLGRHDVFRLVIAGLIGNRYAGGALA